LKKAKTTKERIKGIFRKRIKGELYAGEIIEELYQNIKEKHSWWEINFSSPVYTKSYKTAEYYYMYPQRRGEFDLMEYNSFLLMKAGDKFYILSKGEEVSNTGRRYLGNILAFKLPSYLHDWVIRDSDKVLEYAEHMVQMSTNLSGTLIGANYSGNLFSLRSSPEGVKVMENLTDEIKNFFPKDLEVVDGWVKVKKTGEDAAPKRYKKEIVDFLFHKTMEALNNSR